MKTWILLLFIAGGLTAAAQQKQSLKDLLYSGKLRSDSGSVVRSSDNLSEKIDTGTRKPVQPEVPKSTTVASVTENKTTPVATPVTTDATATDSAATVTTETAAVPESAAPAPVKTNAKIWKEYTETLISGLKTDVLPSKKIKKESYFVVVDYEIGTDGVVTIGNVTSDPENPLLQSEVKSRLDNTPPQLAAVIDSTGKARKTKRKHSFTVTKE